MKEIVVISGKGGTGKTSLSASLVVLFENSVVADCDVDAADLHLVLAPEVRERHEFYAGNEAVIDAERCSGCGLCLDSCRFGAILEGRRDDGRPVFAVDPVGCEGCGVCVRFCPERAIDFPECRCGEWMVSDTRCGPMVHARLAAAAENSGKLVSTVRQQARRIAEEQGRRWIVVDGPPGIGCPVIASVTGADRVVAVTEPTVSGVHDLERVLALTRHFEIPTTVVVNKWDINPELATQVEQAARRAGAQVAGRIRYDLAVTKAQLQGRAVVETDCPVRQDILAVFRSLTNQ